MADNLITYCITPSKLGRLLVAASERGVCFLGIGDNEDDLAAELKKEYPESTPAAPHSTCCELGARVCAYLDTLPAGDQRTLEKANEQMLSIPLDARGTDFQQRVWKMLRTIPAGQAMTYTQLAGQLHMAGGVRAAAHACAANPVSILIPCHRVLRRDGGLGGYRWGLARKQALLQAEGALFLLEL